MDLCNLNLHRTNTHSRNSSNFLNPNTTIVMDLEFVNIDSIYYDDLNITLYYASTKSFFVCRLLRCPTIHPLSKDYGPSEGGGGCSWAVVGRCAMEDFKRFNDEVDREFDHKILDGPPKGPLVVDDGGISSGFAYRWLRRGFYKANKTVWFDLRWWIQHVCYIYLYLYFSWCFCICCLQVDR